MDNLKDEIENCTLCGGEHLSMFLHPWWDGRRACCLCHAKAGLRGNGYRDRMCACRFLKLRERHVANWGGITSTTNGSYYTFDMGASHTIRYILGNDGRFVREGYEREANR